MRAALSDAHNTITTTSSSSSALPHSRSLHKNERGTAPTVRRRHRKRTHDASSNEDGVLAVSARVDGDDDLFSWPPIADAPASPPSKAVIVRGLRAERTKLEEQLAALLDTWRSSIADPSLLSLACEAARQRWITSKFEHEQRLLHEQLLMQQLYLASVQVAVTESPLLRPANSIAIFQAIHDPIHLSASGFCEREHAEKLMVRSDLALKLAPSLAERFANSLVSRAMPQLPGSVATISADDDFTYLSTVSVSKFEGTSVPRVFGAVLHYFESLDSELGKQYNVRHTVTSLQNLGAMRNYARLRYASGSPFNSVSHTVFAASLTESEGIVVIDFVDSDERFAEVNRDSESDIARQRRDISVVLSITAAVDAATGTKCVLVRHMRVHRYNLQPSAPTLLNEIKITQAYNNGELFMAIVCRHLAEFERLAAGDSVEKAERPKRIAE